MTETEAPAPSPASDHQAAWRRLVVGIGVFVAAAIVLVSAAHLAPAAQRQPFDKALARRVKKQAADYVVLGNSMVETRFEENELNRLLAPNSATVLGIGGSKSAYWYLTLKNVILPAHPKRVLLFFRRRELTSPREKATGVYGYYLGRVWHGNEPVVEAKLAPPLREPLERLGYELGRIAPFSRLHALAQPAVESWAHRLSGAAGGASRRKQQRALDAVFATDKLRAADLEPQSAPPEKGSFEELVEASFLPDIIELAENAGVALTFVRIRTRADADGNRRPTAYDRAVDAYLRQRKIELVDMTGAAWEAPEMYGEGDHIAPRYHLQYTRLFIMNMRRVFR